MNGFLYAFLLHKFKPIINFPKFYIDDKAQSNVTHISQDGPIIIVFNDATVSGATTVGGDSSVAVELKSAMRRRAPRDRQTGTGVLVKRVAYGCFFKASSHYGDAALNFMKKTLLRRGVVIKDELVPGLPHGTKSYSEGNTPLIILSVEVQFQSRK